MNTRAKIQYLQKLSEPVLSEVVDYAKNLKLEEKKKTSKKPQPDWGDYVGKLKDSPNFKGDLMKLQRKIRREWG